MTIPKAAFLSCMFVLLNEFVGCWILLIPIVGDYLWLLSSSRFISSVLSLIVLITIFRSINKSVILSFKKANTKYYLIAIALGIVLVFFQSFLNIIYDLKVSPNTFAYTLSFEPLTSLNVIGSIIIVPITEELFFRNYLLRGLLEILTPFKAIILSSLLFGFAHIPFDSFFFDTVHFSLHHAYITAFGGLIAAMLFYKSKSIIPSILFHMLWNFTSSVIP